MADPFDAAARLAAWRERARLTVVALADLATRLDVAYSSSDLHAAQANAELFLSEINRSVVWMLADECPHREAGAELRAGLGVVRNGALLVRRIAAAQTSAQPAPGSDLATSCAALLAQGRAHLTHVEVLTSLR